MEPAVFQFESHRIDRRRKKVALTVKYRRPAARSACNNSGGGSVSKQRSRNQIGLRYISALKCQRGKFNRDQQRSSARMSPKVFPGARQSYSACGATEFGNR